MVKVTLVIESDDVTVEQKISHDWKIPPQKRVMVAYRELVNAFLKTIEDHVEIMKELETSDE